MQKSILSQQWLKKIILILFLMSISSSGIVHCAPKIVLTKTKNILILGDSLSAEYGLARGTGWVALLQQRIQAEKRDVSVINASISGDTTSGGVERIDALLKKHHPTTVVIELGANDGLRGLPVSSVEKNILSLIAKVRATKANVLLVGMQIPPNYGPDYTKQFTGMYKKIARAEKVTLVPFLLDGVADEPELFQADQLHLTAAAHPRILDNIWPYLLPLLSH